MLTDTDAVYVDWGSRRQKPIRRASPEALSAMTFPDGSMGAKVGRPAASPRRPASERRSERSPDLSRIVAGDDGHTIRRQERHSSMTALRHRRAPTSLGLAACTAIVVGNMVGSGFYLSPTAVAPYGQLAILAWIVMGIGAICLGLTFARLARSTPATGGPYAYTRLAYGDFAGFSSPGAIGFRSGRRCR